MTKPIILEADSIRKSFRDRCILSDVYLRCKSGEVIGLLGRNGSGKTTLLKIIFGSMNTPNKSIRFDGQYQQRPFLVPGLIALLPQASFLPGRVKVKTLFKRILNEEGRAQMLADNRIAAMLKKTPGQLSGGECKYLEISLILHLEHRFILLDEPFTGIEPIYRELIVEQLKEASKTRGIIVSDHDYRSVLEISDRLYYLMEGTLRPISGRSDLERLGYISFS